jgi:hypothetical protein
MTSSIPEQIYPFRTTTKQSLRDHDMVAKEVAELGPAFTAMSHRLCHYPKRELAQIAVSLGAGTTLPKPGRLAPRYRAVIVAWFCRHAPDFQGTGIPNPGEAAAAASELRHPRTDDDRNDQRVLDGWGPDKGEWDEYANSA